MIAWVLLPLGLQGIAMAVDELHFHRARGLPRWERWGHPIDTLSVFACYRWALARAPDRVGLGVYAALGAFSCLLVTKDEGVHARRCAPAEHWLHALLFILHPIALGAAAFAWVHAATGLLELPSASMLAFAAYQLTYWNTRRGAAT